MTTRSLSAADEQARDAISRAAKRHAAIDGTVDAVASFMPVPGAGIAVLLSQLAWQWKSLLPRLTEDVAKAYKSAAPHTEMRSTLLEATVVEGVVNAGVALAEAELLGEIGKQVSEAITDAMGPDFLTDLITDALQDNIPGLLGSGIPFFGAPVSATLAAAQGSVTSKVCPVLGAGGVAAGWWRV
jgi:hypothetical protein